MLPGGVYAAVLLAAACADEAEQLPLALAPAVEEGKVSSEASELEGSPAPDVSAAPGGSGAGRSEPGGPIGGLEPEPAPLEPGEGGGSAIDPGAPASPLTSPPLRNPVTLADAELARQALTLLGSSAVGAQGSCRSCHSLGRPTLTRWAQLTADFSTACLSDTQLASVAAADAMLGCLRQRAGKPSVRFTPQSFGIYAAAAHLPWFSFVFEQASPVASGTATHQEFVTRVGMPLAGQAWTQGEFDVVAEWFARRLPGLFELIPEEPGEQCAAGLDPELTRYVEERAVSGWRARNAQVPLLMYGCAPGQSGSACLSSLPRAGEGALGVGWSTVAGSQIRILHDNSELPSFYWSRASADGRFIGAGVLEPGDNDGYGGQILDLEEQRSIAGDFSYDATFFPDNSGFLMQQSGFGRPVALICPQSVLAEQPYDITGEEPGCTLSEGAFGLYQQPAKSLDGEDYLVVHGTYEADNGGFSPVFTQPSAAFEARSGLALTPLLNTGDGFAVGNAVQRVTPLQGDPILSPSGGLLVLRVKGREYSTVINGQNVIEAEQSGYALYRVAQQAGSISIRDLGRVCLTGGKAIFSYDERWLVFHHYVQPSDAQALGFSGPDDPAFAAYRRRGASNLMLVDLRSGAAQRITSMAPGEYAVFPHFRSDGWIYFVVRTLEGTEYFAASDAALVLE